jgi:hypothetical protein
MRKKWCFASLLSAVIFKRVSQKKPHLQIAACFCLKCRAAAILLMPSSRTCHFLLRTRRVAKRSWEKKRGG